MNIGDLIPGMDHVSTRVKVLSISKSKQVTTGTGIQHEILEAKVEDETGSITLVLWDEKISSIKVEEVLQIENGFVTSFKGEWRINVGKYGNIAKV